jgi:hypothetical protein
LPTPAESGGIVGCVTIGCRIQTHPARAHLIPRLTQRLEGFETMRVIEDPEPVAFANAWRSYQACLESLDEETHLLVIQDDAIPCRHLAAVAARIVAAHPDRIICLFVGGAPPRSAERVRQAGWRDDRYVELDPADWLPCVATIYPHRAVSGILEFVDARRWRHGHLGDDHRLGEYVRHTGDLALATVPNLVQHPDTVKSLIGTHAMAGMNPARVACCWIGDHDPLALDW